MKRPKDAGEQLRNEMAAMAMIEAGSPEWLALYRQVKEYMSLSAIVKAGSGKVPADNKRFGLAERELNYVLNTLAEAERQLAEPPPVFNSAAAEGGAT